jgi:glycosyltransferase involved in cell wall biosynthesis
MRILFYSPSHQGHHFAYLSRMLPAFIELPVELCLATTPDAIASEEYASTLARFSDRLIPYPVCTTAPRGPFKNSRHRLRELTAAIQRLHPDHVAVCYADGLWQLAAIDTLIGRRPWPAHLDVEGWIYRTRFGDSTDKRLKSRIERWLFARLVRHRTFSKLHLDGELLFEFARHLVTPTSAEIVLTPNPVVVESLVPAETARRELGLPVDGKWLSLSGMIARYKGADLLLNAFRSICEVTPGASLRLLFAGPHEPYIRQLLATPPFASFVAERRIVSLDRIVDEHEMFLAAAAADLVLAPYPRHQGRSSIILWAAAAGRPSLGVADGGIGHVIRQQKLGATCNVLDPDEFATSIVRSLEAPWTDQDINRVRNYALGHRIENYQSVASQLVRTRLAEEPAT